MQKQNPLLRVWELGKSQHSGLICAVISAFLGVLGGMLPYFAAAQMIVNLLEGNRDMSLYFKWLCIGMAGYLVRTLLYTLALSISHKATFSVLKTIRQKILAKLPKLPLGTVTDMSSGKMKQLIVDQVDGMETTLAHLFPELTANIAGPILIIVYLFILDWRMALLSLVSIKAFNQGKSSYAKFSDRVKANAKYYYNWMKKSQFGMSMAYSIVPATLITILPVGFVFYRGGSLSAEVFITTVILALGITGPLMAAMNFVDTLAQVGTTVESVDEVLLAEEQQHEEKNVTFGKMDIGLSHVSFGYHGDKEILHDVSLAIPAGTMTALVGPSGSGKSTIAKLISGFWDVQSGTVTIGGVDEKKIPLKQLYDQAAFVSQDNFLFDETVRENIRMGRMSATDAEIEAACRAAGCDGFIRELEKGYDTKVGSGGAHLSGGERQRIAIARAMLKDAPIVILDEATAYIDPENEAVIQEAIAKLVKGKTVIVIAHRLSTIKDADKIVVVKDGRIMASGRHEELRESCPLYESMWQAHIGAKDGDVA